MLRREFLNQSAVAIAAAALGSLDANSLELAAFGNTRGDEDTTFQFTKLNNANAVAPMYLPGARAVGPSPSPYVYAYYDDFAKKFMNPLASDANGVKPSLAKGSYSVTPTLQAFNVRKDTQMRYKNLKNQIQLGLNATAPISESEQLSWIFVNAVDIFLAKDDQGRQDQLSKFTKNNSPGTSLTTNPKISVTNGLMNLQVTAFGQKQDSIWTKFFDVLSKVTGSPLVSTVSKGFGIPGLVTEAVTFVDGVMDAIAQQDKLVPLWQTGGLQFAVTTDANARFNMKPGIWAVIDSDYAQHTQFLDGHTVDLTYQSFRILDKSNSGADANYLVTNFDFTKS